MQVVVIEGLRQRSTITSNEYHENIRFSISIGLLTGL